MSIRLVPTMALAAALLSPSWPAAAQSDARAAARAHFERGVAAFNARRFGEAGEEFATAYKLSPAFPVLYNIGQVNVALGRPVEAVEAFERYLREGTTVPTERRREVESEIAKQLERIGEVAVRTAPDGAEVRVDGRLVGKSPLIRPLRLSAGIHTVQALLAGHAAQTRDVEVRGKARMDVELRLEPFASSPAISAAPVPVVPPVAGPPLAGAPGSLASAPFGQVPADPAPPGRGQRVLGYALMGAGAVAGVTGVLVARSGAEQASEASDRLKVATTVTYPKITPEFEDGKSKNQLGWAIAGVGAALAVGGVVVVATAPKKTTDDLAWTPMVAPRAGGLAISGAF